ncbi:hypothetical protein AVEN_70153-1 [Araneus ventricosus]|uniref:Uncharacterized protein n=1 Tax=Araneus ventricosus TaxID=182803 RepID=A0A4Y2LMW2_ARAVE|nr:hypothetical protein AVEN_70153-1 [Araneus ventricosus]
MLDGYCRFGWKETGYSWIANDLLGYRMMLNWCYDAGGGGERRWIPCSEVDKVSDDSCVSLAGRDLGFRGCVGWFCMILYLEPGLDATLWNQLDCRWGAGFVMCHDSVIWNTVTYD